MPEWIAAFDRERYEWHRPRAHSARQDGRRVGLQNYVYEGLDLLIAQVRAENSLIRLCLDRSRTDPS
jgi:hypothetical protein